MFRKPLLTVVLGSALLFSGPAVLFAQQRTNGGEENTEETPAEEGDKTKTGDAPAPGRFWQATLPGGNFMVALDKIASVSRHKYVLDGALIVDEVTVDTVGQALARFYYITPITDEVPGSVVKTVTDRGRELLDSTAKRAGVDVQDMVVKKYPDTTHAKSIEYRLLNAQDLNSLYSSVKNAWESGRGRQYTAR